MLSEGLALQAMQYLSNSKALQNEKTSESPVSNGGEGAAGSDLATSSPPNGFDPGWRFYTSFTSLCIITLAVALDATSLSVALPVILPLLAANA